jgi:hypothetical protein
MRWWTSSTSNSTTSTPHSSSLLLLKNPHRSASILLLSWEMAKNTIFQNEKHNETYDLTSFMANPTAQMLKNISKLVCMCITGVFPQHFKRFLPNFNIKILYVFVPSLA